MSKTSEDKKWGVITHLAALSGLLFPLGIVLGPLLVWLLKRNDSHYLDVQGKRAVNFQLTILIAAFVLAILSAVIKPLLVLTFFSGIIGMVFAIIAAVKANQQANYHYPFSLKLLK